MQLIICQLIGTSICSCLIRTSLMAGALVTGSVATDSSGGTQEARTLNAGRYSFLEARAGRLSVVNEGCVEEGDRPVWRKEMAAARLGSAARTTGGGGKDGCGQRCHLDRLRVLDRRPGLVRHRGRWAEESFETEQRSSCLMTGSPCTTRGGAE
jgi:hypothetical protein